MKRYIIFATLAFFSSLTNVVKADFGEASFPENYFLDGPKSYHDGWCRFLKNECRIRFQGAAMWVEGQGGIFVDQYKGYKYSQEKKGSGFAGIPNTAKHFNYIFYESKNGEQKQALFLFINDKSQRFFVDSFLRWKKQDGTPIPNYRYPADQGPQTEKGRDKGRDKGLNPYKNEPIIDFKIETKDFKDMRGNINCNSPVWRNKPRCN